MGIFSGKQQPYEGLNDTQKNLVDLRILLDVEGSRISKTDPAGDHRPLAFRSELRFEGRKGNALSNLGEKRNASARQITWLESQESAMRTEALEKGLDPNTAIAQVDELVKRAYTKSKKHEQVVGIKPPEAQPSSTILARLLNRGENRNDNAPSEPDAATEISR